MKMKHPPIWELPWAVEVEPVIRWCCEEHRVNRLLMSARLHQDGSGELTHPRVDDLMENLFGASLLDRREVTRWQGNELVGHNGLVYEVDFSPALVKKIAAINPSLYAWRHHHDPPLPEDFCLFRLGERWPRLVTVTHEHFGWILSDRKVPILGAELTDHTSEDVLIVPNDQV